MHQLRAKEHKQLTDMLSTLHKDVQNGRSQSNIFKQINNFVLLAEEHFKNEEKLMVNIQYPQFSEHKAEHSRLLDQLQTMQRQLNSGQTPFGEECLLWLKNWLFEHISTTDKELDVFLSQQ